MSPISIVFIWHLVAAAAPTCDQAGLQHALRHPPAEDYLAGFWNALGIANPRAEIAKAINPMAELESHFSLSQEAALALADVGCS